MLRANSNDKDKQKVTKLYPLLHNSKVSDQV